MLLAYSIPFVLIVLALQAILMDLVNHHNDKVTIDEIKKKFYSLIVNPKKKRTNGITGNTAPLTKTSPKPATPGTPGRPGYAYRCQTKQHDQHHHLATHALLPIENIPPPPSPITHILDAREFIENHLLAVCQNPIALAEVYDHTVLRAHSCGYPLSENPLCDFR